MDLGSVKFENSLKPSKTEGVPILSLGQGYFTFSTEKTKKENCGMWKSKFGDIFIGWLGLVEIRRWVLKRRGT